MYWGSAQEHKMIFESYLSAAAERENTAEELVEMFDVSPEWWLIVLI